MALLSSLTVFLPVSPSHLPPSFSLLLSGGGGDRPGYRDGGEPRSDGLRPATCRRLPDVQLYAHLSLINLPTPLCSSSPFLPVCVCQNHRLPDFLSRSYQKDMAAILSGFAIDKHFLTLRLVFVFFLIWDKLVTRPPSYLCSPPATLYCRLFYMLEWLLCSQDAWS